MPLKCPGNLGHVPRGRIPRLWWSGIIYPFHQACDYWVLTHWRTISIIVGYRDGRTDGVYAGGPS